ncbi:MAG: class I SAM-dependent methyltransferase [Armatimonadetes bacterium]|nr:class I SAM-dependent methyltransferase [Armatimonadota bacterium]
MQNAPDTAPRAYLFVTTASRETPALLETARALAAELRCPLLPRHGGGVEALFAAHPARARAILVQTERLLLVDRGGQQFFAHPGMGYLRFRHVVDTGRDTLLDVSGAGAGDAVLDCTLGFASEATLFAHAVGESGLVDGVEAVPEVGVVVRAGLKSVQTKLPALNAAMRRVRVAYLGSHTDYLRDQPDNSYDIVYFDPFFETVLTQSESFAPLRSFGSHSPLTAETIRDAVRVARRCVVVKTTRWGDALESFGITERVESKNGRVAYGVIRK